MRVDISSMSAWWWFGAAAGVGVIGATARIRLRTLAAGWRVVGVGLIVAAGGLAGAWATARLQGSAFPGEAGVGCLVVPVAILWIASPLLRVSALRAGDCLLAPLLGGVALAHVGGFIVGSMVGSFSALPWAVRLPSATPTWQLNVLAGLISEKAHWSLPTHPVPLYLALIAAGLALSFLARERKTSADRPAGDLWISGVALYAAGAALVSPFRDDYPGSPQPFFGETNLIVAVLLASVLVGRLWRTSLPQNRAAPPLRVE